MEDPFYFSIEKARTGLCFIKNENPKKTPESVLNAVAVIVVPIHNMKWAASITERLTHSVVILIDKTDNEGFLIEYTNNNRVTVRILSGKLANMPMNIPRKSGCKPMSNLSNGFYSCHITQKRLFEFSQKYTALRDYHNIVHNCQIFHRSLIVSAISNIYMYNLKQSEGNAAHLSSSHDWIQIEGNNVVYRKDIIEGLSVNNILTFTLTEKLKSRTIPIGDIENNCQVIFDEDKHTIIMPKGIDLNVNEESDYVNTLKSNLVEAFSKRLIDDVRSILRKFQKMDYSDDDTVEAEYILSHIFSIQQAIEKIKVISSYFQTVLDDAAAHPVGSEASSSSEESVSTEKKEDDEDTMTEDGFSPPRSRRSRSAAAKRRFFQSPPRKAVSSSVGINVSPSLKVSITIPFWRVLDREYRHALHALVDTIRRKNTRLDLEELYEVYHRVGITKRCVVLTKQFMRLWVVVNFSCQHRVNVGSALYEQVMEVAKRDTNTQGKNIYKSQILDKNAIIAHYSKDLNDAVVSMNNLMRRLKAQAEVEPIYSIQYDLLTKFVMFLIVGSVVFGALYVWLDNLMMNIVKILPFIGVLVFIRIGRKLYEYYKM